MQQDGGHHSQVVAPRRSQAKGTAATWAVWWERGPVWAGAEMKGGQGWSTALARPGAWRGQHWPGVEDGLAGSQEMGASRSSRWEWSRGVADMGRFMQH